MSPAQEVQVGASEHEKIVQQFGLYDDAALNAYVNQVGQRVTRDTERPDVQYKFFVIDSPIVNAFALPGGYIYVSRGLLALANNEAELAAVLAHEAGHITGRHSAERYSHGVVTSLGAAVLSAALESSAASQALGVGSNLYLSSYSRGQENQADSLGLRYMTRAGYNPAMMSSFLESLERYSRFEAQKDGRSHTGYNYFSTHPATAERVSQTRTQAGEYGQGGDINAGPYLENVNGMVFGDSDKQGFVRGQSFLHPVLGFAFDVPQGFRLINQSDQVVASGPGGAVVVFDMASRGNAADIGAYLQNAWMRGEPLSGFETLEINGRPAATASFPGRVNGQTMTIRLVAIEWKNGQVVRFQMAIPGNASAALVDNLKRATYSFRDLTPEEKAGLKPYRLQVVTAGGSDTAATLAGRQPFGSENMAYFSALNGAAPVIAGQRYKIVQ